MHPRLAAKALIALLGVASCKAQLPFPIEVSQGTVSADAAQESDQTAEVGTGKSNSAVADAFGVSDTIANEIPTPSDVIPDAKPLVDTSPDITVPKDGVATSDSGLSCAPLSDASSATQMQCDLCGSFTCTKGIDKLQVQLCVQNAGTDAAEVVATVRCGTAGIVAYKLLPADAFQITEITGNLKLDGALVFPNIDPGVFYVDPAGKIILDDALPFHFKFKHIGSAGTVAGQFALDYFGYGIVAPESWTNVVTVDSTSFPNSFQ